MLGIIFTASLLLLQSNIVSAHHAFAADYDSTVTGAIEGKVVEVFYRNPHAHYYVEVAGKDGAKEIWDIQTMNTMALNRIGWTKNSIKVGDKLKVNGILGRHNKRRVAIGTVEKEDGTILNPYKKN